MLEIFRSSLVAMFWSLVLLLFLLFVCHLACSLPKTCVRGLALRARGGRRPL